MFAGMEMFGGVLVLGGVAAAHVAAFSAETQVNPTVAHFQAFFAALGVRMNIPNVAQVRADGAHTSSFSAASELF
jgi:hypothetical protein